MDKSAERRARAAATRIGWRVEKSREQQHINNLGMLMLLDENNIVVDGINYDCPPERIIFCCERIRDTPWGERRAAYSAALKELAHTSLEESK